MVALAFALEAAFSPPYWVHLVVLTPVMVGLIAGMLRPFKGLLIAAQFVNDAGEGRPEA